MLLSFFLLDLSLSTVRFPLLKKFAIKLAEAFDGAGVFFLFFSGVSSLVRFFFALPIAGVLASPSLFRPLLAAFVALDIFFFAFLVVLPAAEGE